MKIKSVLAIANKENLNGRVYSPEVLQDMVKQFENNKPMFGELGTSSKSCVSIKNASHKITSMKINKPRLPRKNKKFLKKQGLYEGWKNKNKQVLIGTIKLLNTPNGDLAKKMFENQSVVIRPRGFGNVVNGNIENFSLISFDITNKDDDSFSGII